MFKCQGTTYLNDKLLVFEPSDCEFSFSPAFNKGPKKYTGQ
jgi:hypothetical protein